MFYFEFRIDIYLGLPGLRLSMAWLALKLFYCWLFLWIFFRSRLFTLEEKGFPRISDVGGAWR